MTIDSIPLEQGDGTSLASVPSPLPLIPSTNSAEVVPYQAPLRCEDPKGWLRVTCLHGSVAWSPMRCRHCEPCWAVRRQKVAARCIYAMEQADWLGFVTFTTVNDEDKMDWPDIMRKWACILRWIRKRYGWMEYCAVKEEGKGGMRHLHVIFAGWVWVPLLELRREWFRLTGANQVWVKRVDTANGVATYLAKYLGKSRLDLGKLVTYSLGFPKRPKLELWDMVVYLQGSGPEERPWVAISKGGTLVEHWGPGGPCDCFGLEERMWWSLTLRSPGKRLVDDAGKEW